MKKTIVAGLVLVFFAYAFHVSRISPTYSTFVVLEAISWADDFSTRKGSIFLGPKQEIPGSKPDMSLENLTSLESAEMKSWLRRTHTKALLIAQNGKIVHESYEERFEKGLETNGLSMAKPVIALLVGIAIEEGKIDSVDQSIVDFLPEIPESRAGNVTIRHLLKHTSGVRDMLPNVLRMKKGHDITDRLSKLGFVKKKNMVYANTNYHLLNIILQRAYDLPLNKIIEQKLWSPMGLEQASTINTTGYCCLFASVRSWWAIGELMLNKGMHLNQRIVSAEWVAQMVEDKTEPRYFVSQLTSTHKNNTYAYGLYGGIADAPEVYWAVGMGLQFVLIDPVRKMVVVRMGDLPSIIVPGSIRHDEYLGESLIDLMKFIDSGQIK